MGHVKDVRGGEEGGWLDDVEDSCDPSSMGEHDETEEAEEEEEEARDSADMDDASSDNGRRRPGKRLAKVAFCSSSSKAMDLECHASYKSSPRK